MGITSAGDHSETIIINVIRHLLAPHVPQAAAALRIQRAASGRRGRCDHVRRRSPPGGHAGGAGDSWREADIKATFFLVGEQVERRPALAAEIAGQGHLVALHGYRHRPQPTMSQKAVQDDVERGVAAIERATQIRPNWHRPPYGLYSPAGLEAVRDRSLRPLLWSRWGKDWRRFTTPARIAARATANLRPGDVILLHDADFYSSRGSHERTVEALALIVRELKRHRIGTVLPV